MLTILENYITEEQEAAILSSFRPSKIKITTGRNSRRRYGSSLPYPAPLASKVIPPLYQTICKRLHEEKLTSSISDSVTVNEYLPSQSINWHIDSPSSGPIIVVLSLESEAVMGLRRKGENRSYTLPARSLLVMDGEERSEWEHCIFPVSSHRISVVFRKGTK